MAQLGPHASLDNRLAEVNVVPRQILPSLSPGKPELTDLMVSVQNLQQQILLTVDQDRICTGFWWLLFEFVVFGPPSCLVNYILTQYS